jgi:hypothetical protein
LAGLKTLWEKKKYWYRRQNFYFVTRMLSNIDPEYDATQVETGNVYIEREGMTGLR